MSAAPNPARLRVAGTLSFALTGAVPPLFGLALPVYGRVFGPRGPGMVGLVNAVFVLGAIIAPWAVLVAAGQPGPAWAVLPVLAALGMTALVAVLSAMAATALILVGVFAATGEGPRPRVPA